MTKQAYKLKITRDKSKNVVDSLLDLSTNGVGVGLNRINQERLNLVCVVKGGNKGEDLYIIFPESRLYSIPHRKIVLYTPEQLQVVYKRAVTAQQNRQKSAFLDIFYVQVNQLAESINQRIAQDVK